MSDALSDDELVACLGYGGETAVDAVMQHIQSKDRKEQDNSTLVLVDVRS